MAAIAVIDYDMGNLHSACKGLENAGAQTVITDNPGEILGADGVVLPGVGSFDPAMEHLRSRGLEGPIKQAIAQGKPFLGICLGLQILFEASEEGQEQGLGIIPGRVKHFQKEPTITIPHMGWNQLTYQKPDHPLFADLPAEPYVYFVHSYYVEPHDLQVQAATAQHGSQIFTAAIARDNLMAVQFHPEKSSVQGLKMLANFVALVENSGRQ